MDNKQDMGDLTILDLFRLEVEAQAAIFKEGLLALETQPQSSQTLESLMRAAHAVKGVADLVEIDAAASLSHSLEEYFVTAQNQTITLAQIPVLRLGVDALLKISQVGEADLDLWLSEHHQEISTTTQKITALLTGTVEMVVLNIHREITEPISPPPPPPPPPPPITEEVVNISDTSMLDLFRLEVEGQANILNEGLLSLESQPQSAKVLESLMRAAHSIKGAARIVAIDAAVNLAHLMEDCFVAAQNHTITLEADDVDVLLQGVDLLLNISQLEPVKLNPWLSEHRQQITATRQQIAGVLTGEKTQTTGRVEIAPPPPPPTQTPAGAKTASVETTSIVKPKSSELTNVEPTGQPTIQLLPTNDRVVRVNAENLNRIMGLAGESLIEANWLQPFADSLMILKKRQLQLSKILQQFQEAVAVGRYQESQKYLEAARLKESECREILGDRLDALELFARRTASLSDRLYREVIASNMRPFADGVQGFPRMIRDLARSLGKQVKFDILGKSTPVDRDILKKLEAPLTHILRNSVDHGIELPEERLAVDKLAEGTVRLEAVHRGGMLSITISDDGRGINFDWLRQKIVTKGLTSSEMVDQLSESELMEFLFLPGFSTAKQVTEISGRGVGLDIAKSMAQEVGGNVRAFSVPGKGMTFHFQLPLTLSVVRTLLVEISGEPYAFPLARIEQIVMVEKKEIYSIENRQYFTMDNKNIGLVSAHQVLELPESTPKSDALPVVIIGEQSDYYGLVVDRFLGEHDLVVRPLDPRLGKVQDISAAALMGDGSPILIVDISDLIRSVDNLLNNSKLSRFDKEISTAILESRKSILVVDDSITVREMERKLLENKGYKVDVAVDGVEGWYTVSNKHYDLVISDIDMPRMNGIELVSKIKNNPKLNSIPIIIVSYKDREEDRLRGLEAGADYYLTKASFHDDTLVNAVLDLIGN
ncbi:MAG: response regulator [Gloeotrichia echinulata IR180]